MSCGRAEVVIPSTLLVKLGDADPVEMDLEEYVRNSLPAYLTDQAPAAALQAVCIAIRSTAVTSRQHARHGFDVCTGEHCLAWQPAKRGKATDRAVDETTGQVLTLPPAGSPPAPGTEPRPREGVRLVPAPFFVKCDGHTRSSLEVWRVSLGHCLPVSCACENSELEGHGVGLCVAGAVAMAGQGASAQEILEHYYTGARAAPATRVERSRLCQSLILGRVVDSAGRPQPGARLVLSGPAGPFRRTAFGDGRFWFSGLLSGDWELGVEGSATRQADLHTDGRSTHETQIILPGLPTLELETLPVAHPKMLIGTLGYGKVPVTLTGTSGVETTVESGSAPDFDPGGFVVALPPAGPCTVEVLGQRFTVEIGDTGLWLRFTPKTTTGPS